LIEEAIIIGYSSDQFSDPRLMMRTIKILPEITNERTIYRAICGSVQTTGLTPGQALDSTLQKLSTSEDTIVILQRFSSDDLFTERQQTRLQELINQFQESVATNDVLSPQQQQELENLIEAEWEAAINRSERIVQQTHSQEQTSL
jgi:organic radical activating enzyme